MDDLTYTEVMARASDGGTGSRIIISPLLEPTVENPWTLDTYPYPNPAFAVDDDRETAISEDRLFWRESGILAYGAGKSHPVDEEDRLITWAELSKPPETLPKKREGRR